MTNSPSYSRELRLRVARSIRKVLAEDPIPLIFDTETTGTNEKAEIVEIAVVDISGKELLNTLVKPKYKIPEEVSQLHGIFNSHVKNSPNFLEILPQFLNLIEGRTLIAYGIDFDLRMVMQSALHQGFDLRVVNPPSPKKVRCAKEAFSRFWQEPSNWKKGYKWIKLSIAAEMMNVKIPRTVHAALSDALLTQRLLTVLATYSGEENES